MAKEIRENIHDRNLVHLQLHPGNWFIRFNHDVSQASAVITDWSTVEELDHLPKILFTKGLEKDEGWSERKLSPAQKAKAIDLINYLNDAVVHINLQGGRLNDRVIYKAWAINLDSQTGFKRQTMNDEQLLHRGLEMLAASILGYEGGDFDQVKISNLSQVLNDEFERICVQACKRAGLTNVTDLQTALNHDWGESIVKNGLKLTVNEVVLSLVTNPQSKLSSRLLDPNSNFKLSEEVNKRVLESKQPPKKSLFSWFNRRQRN
jgi:hypothetical protein